MKFLFSTIFLSVLIISCNNDASRKKIPQTHKANTLNTNENTTKEIAQNPNLAVENTDTISTPLPEPDTIIHAEIEKKFGLQWDFCNCIKAIDSIEKALESETTAESDFDFLLQRSDYIDSKCKEITATPNNTVEEREIHFKKVQNCLNN
ncbi:hypothetical protein [Lishizhenia sp.]|uniref:hypothetical protein n=1 Tax=Lishizhenia sp. TaxID=2497594 RepID=UPI00299EEA5D|nr:hypothetical protein [Lishizhenia sp.]MDX1446770.1 hypothetical protein [Lishizhenia sp.]